MKLISIPKNKYDDYRLSVIFDGYKWDPQFLDDNTIAKYALVLTQEEHQHLSSLVEKLGKETEAAEKMMIAKPKIMTDLKLPLKMKRMIPYLKNYDASKHVRLMRFDFHLCTDGRFMLSEVNSDVPGGFAEASIMPEIALKYLGSSNYDTVHFGNILLSALKKKVKENGRIMMVHCTSYSDDRQVMQFLGEKLKGEGFEVIYGAADHLYFVNNEAYCNLDNNEGKVDAIVRFNPIEWVVDIKPKTWFGYFETNVSACNHALSVLCQSKRFPLIWDHLEKEGVDLSTWRLTLPDTQRVKDVKGKDGYIYKPVWGRVGEGISIKEACKEDEYNKIMKEVKRHPNRYIAQKQFDSKALISDDKQAFHVALGAYYVEGKAAGYYARLSKTRRVDSHAQDIPVLIEKG